MLKRYGKLVKAVLAALLGASYVAIARADTIAGTYSVAADTFIDYKYSNTNYSVSPGYSLYLNYDGKPGRMLLDMPTISAPADMQVESVALHVYCYGGAASEGMSLQAHVLNNNYDFSTITWANSNGTSYSDNYVLSSAIAKGYYGWLTFDLTSLWGDAIETNGAIITFDESNPPSTSWYRVDLTALDSNSAYAPYLTVTFASVPEPATAGLAAAGAISGALFLGYRRKRLMNEKEKGITL